jgi:hypothetical protein
MEDMPSKLKLPDGTCKKNCYTCASSKGACEYTLHKGGCPRGFCKNTETNETVTEDRGTQSAPVAPAGVVRRGGAPSARPEKGKEE